MFCTEWLICLLQLPLYLIGCTCIEVWSSNCCIRMFQAVNSVVSNEIYSSCFCRMGISVPELISKCSLQYFFWFSVTHHAVSIYTMFTSAMCLHPFYLHVSSVSLYIIKLRFITYFSLPGSLSFTHRWLMSHYRLSYRSNIRLWWTLM
jgi:hypothetical protein